MGGSLDATPAFKEARSRKRYDPRIAKERATGHGGQRRVGEAWHSVLKGKKWRVLHRNPGQTKKATQTHQARQKITGGSLDRRPGAGTERSVRMIHLETKMLRRKGSIGHQKSQPVKTVAKKA